MQNTRFWTFALVIILLIFTRICLRTRGEKKFTTENNHSDHQQRTKIKTPVINSKVFEQQRKCFEQSWNNHTNKVHPKAPIHQLLPGMEIIEDNSDAMRLSEKCSNNPSESLRVLMINSRIGSFLQREALRETYIPNLLKNSSEQLSWIYFFSTNKASTKFRGRINAEKNKYGDLITFNTPEGYNLTPLKILASMKLVNCFCPNVAYFLKADDDSYLRIEEIDQELPKLQQRVDQNFPALRLSADGKKSSLGHAPLNSGGKCNVQPVPRKYQHSVPFDSIPQKIFPFKYCWGQMSVWSKPVIERIVSNCATHCIGFYGGQQDFNFSRPCLWRPEDMFLGSCIHALFSNEIVIEEITNSGHALARKSLFEMLYTTHHIVGMDRNSPQQIKSTHQLYSFIDKTFG